MSVKMLEAQDNDVRQEDEEETLVEGGMAK
jgi:hypothetical protein